MNEGWSTVTVAGHACDVFEPPRPSEHGYVVIYLHGVHLSRLHDKYPFVEAFVRHGLRVIAPMTQRSWWTDRICQEFDPNVTAQQYVMQSVLPYIGERWGTAPPRIALLGTSMGGQGALRFSFKFPDKFPVVAAISPAIDYQQRFDEGDETLPLMYRDREQARQDTATLHIHPLNWPRNTWFCCDPADYRWHDSAEKLHMKLAALGIPHDYNGTATGGGHGFEYYNRMAPHAIDFIAERLDKERRRLA